MIFKLLPCQCVKVSDAMLPVVSDFLTESTKEGNNVKYVRYSVS